MKGDGESYLHDAAKNVLAGLIRDRLVQSVGVDLGCVVANPNRRSRPHKGIWIEYPVCRDLSGTGACDVTRPIWDERIDNPQWQDRPPTYSELVDAGMPPLAIFDVALTHEGMLVGAFEVVHRHGVSDEKRRRIRWLGEHSPIQGVWTISALELLRQVRPERFMAENLLTGLAATVDLTGNAGRMVA